MITDVVYSGAAHFLMAFLIPSFAALSCALLSRWQNIRDSVTLLSGFALLYVVWDLQSIFWQSQNLVLWEALEVMPGITLAFSLEPLGLIFALLAAFLWPVTTLYAIGYMRGNRERHQSRFFACFALAIFAVMGIAFADNLYTLFAFYELMTLCTYPLVAHGGNDAARHGARVYIGILMGTSVGLLLPAIIAVQYFAGTVTFEPGGVMGAYINPVVVSFLLLLFAYGIGKAALMPIHRWLPAAMVAPTPVSALLHAVAVVKAGVFSFVKIIVYIFGVDFLAEQVQTNWWYGGWMVPLAGATIILASLVAMKQDNLKRLLAYSTVSQLSYIIMSVMVLAPLSVIGAAFHIAAHAFGKITLFFAAGAIYTASKKTKVSQMRGIGKRMPWTMGAFAVGVLSMIGVPPAVGFSSKWFMLMGAVSVEQYVAVAVILLSTLLNAMYFLPIVYTAFFKNEEPISDAVVKQDHREAPWIMVLPILVTAGAVLGLFFWPDVIFQYAASMGAVL